MFLVKSNKKKYKFLFNQILIFTVGIIILILISIPLSKNIKKRIIINKEIKDLEEEISAIENKNNQLNEMITYLESDNFIEEQARLNLGLKKEGEEVLVIAEQAIKSGNGNNGNQANSSEGDPTVKIGFLQWFDYFFNNENK